MKYYNALLETLLDKLVEGYGEGMVLNFVPDQELFLDSHIYVECQGEYVTAIYTYRGKYDNWKSGTHLDGSLVPILVYNKQRDDYDIFWEGSNLCLRFLALEAEREYLDTVKCYLTEFADVQEKDASEALDKFAGVV